MEIQFADNHLYAPNQIRLNLSDCIIQIHHAQQKRKVSVIMITPIQPLTPVPIALAASHATIINHRMHAMLTTAR